MNPHKKSTSIILVLLVALLLVMAIPNGYVLAAENDQALNSLGKGDGQKCCVPVKVIRKVRSERILRRNGFYIDLYGTGSLTFSKEGKYKFGTLRVDEDSSGGYTAARITEVDTSRPPSERIKCWQPTDRFDVVVNYTIRLKETVNPGLTENMILWNAPIGHGESFLFTAIGLTRNLMFPGEYVALVAQDFNAGDYSGTFEFELLDPDWLDPTAWHHVRLTVSEYAARVEIAQGDHDYTVVLDVDLPNPVEPLAMEFSLDNEVHPDLPPIPITTSDALDIASFSIRYKVHK